MKPVTLYDFTHMPAAYGIGSRDSFYCNFYGPKVRQACMQAYITFAYNGYYVANVFNYVIYGLVGLMILIAMSLRLFNYVAAKKALPSWLIRLRTFFAKHIGLASVFGGKASEPYAVFGLKWATVQVPARAHFTIIFLYVLFNSLVSFCWYSTPVPNLLYPNLGYNWDALIRGFSDRTGILAIGATPLALILAGRNSPVAALTGCSYTTLQIYHRWVSRMAAGHAISHAIGYSLMEGLDNIQAYKFQFTQDYWNWGVAATVGGSICAFGSFRRLREIAYETFLILHIVGALVWVIGSYYHVYLRNPDYMYLKYIYSAIAFWGFDRLARWVRLAYLNFSLGGSKHGNVKRSILAAEGYLTPCGDFVRLRITMARSWPRKMGGAGKYVFISSPTIDPHTNHPFTITWPTGMPSLEPSTPSSGSGSSSPSDSEEKKEFPFSSGGFSTSDVAGWSEQSAEENNASFEVVLRSYSGFTKKLAKKLAKASGGEAGSSGGVEKVKIFVEGPYGEGVELSHLDALLLVAGGSGIAACTAHLAELAQAHAAGTLKTKRVTLVWSIRQLDTIHILLPYLRRLQSLLPADFLTVVICHTGSTDSLKSTSDSALLEDLFKPVRALASVKLYGGRPYLPEYLDALRTEGEKVAVSACGPLGLCDHARETVRSRLGTNGWTADNLEYHDEVFTW
ncbi:hypothetical protein JCM11251_002716 [Rhodosporidiobolus azoricus]